MCLNPKRIRNTGFMRLGGMPYVTIPCGMCKECQEVKSIDYYLRTIAIYHTLFPKDRPSHWSVWFCTFTYNSDNLPYVDCWKTYDPDDRTRNYIGRFPSFNHEHIKRFLKSFKQFFVRDLGLPTPHILCTCEYGKEKHRPHYHLLMFLPKQFNSWQQFRDIVLRYWHYGFVKNLSLRTIDAITQERHVCNSIKYVTKYACKGSSWLPEYIINNYITDIRPFDCRPRVFTTNGYGEQLQYFMQDSDFLNGTFYFSDLKKTRKYNIPQYLKRKFFIKNDYKLVEKIKYSEDDASKFKHLPYFCKEKDLKTKYKYFNNSSHINGYDDINKQRFRNSYEKSLFRLQNDIYWQSRCWKSLLSSFTCISTLSFNQISKKIVVDKFLDKIVDNNYISPIKQIDDVKIPTPDWQYVTSQMFVHFLPFFDCLPEEQKDKDFEYFCKWVNAPCNLHLRYYVNNLYTLHDYTFEEYVFLMLLDIGTDLERFDRQYYAQRKQEDEEMWLSLHCPKPDE